MPAAYSRPVARSPKSDPQQYRVYRMEAECIGAKKYVELSLPKLRRFARAVCRAYGMPQVRVEFADLGEWGAEWSPPATIKINPYKQGTRDLVTLAHELAHHLHEYLAPGADHEPHGPEFMLCYVSILDTARMIPAVGMMAVLDKYKIRYINPGKKRSVTTLHRKVVRGRPSARLA